MSHITFTKPLCWSTIDIVIDSDALTFPVERLDLVIEDVYQEALRLQSIFNFFDSTSELSGLNTHRTGLLSAPLRELISLWLMRTARTAGAYDITIGKQILQRKSKKAITPLQSTYTDVRIEGNQVTLLHPDIMIDLGSIAKGYIADRLAEHLVQQGCQAWLLDARGDIIAFGSYREPLAIQAPRDPDREIAHFVLKQSGVATSGDYHQFDSSFEESHILHQHQRSSLTIIAPTLTQADLFATILFVCDPAMRDDILDHHPELQILAVDRDNRIVCFNDPKHKYTVLASKALNHA